MFDSETRNAIKTIAADLGVQTAALKAIVEVESGGRMAAKIGGRNEPLIRFEGHYFYRLLPAQKRGKAITNGLAASRYGKVRNPSSQSARWRLLKRACQIDRDAALQSVSWGCGQVMGAHWRWLDYASIDALVGAARKNPAGQIDLMARFIKKSGLGPLLRACNWAGFARRYNGPSYRKFKYDQRMARAYAKYAANDVSAQKSNRRHNLLLRLGASGSAVRQLQRDLNAHGYALKVDGDFGPLTQRAVIAFQRARHLVIDGIVGPKTFVALQQYHHVES